MVSKTMLLTQVKRTVVRFTFLLGFIAVLALQGQGIARGQDSDVRTELLNALELQSGVGGDVESCYAYARGQVDHDVRIESDVASAFDSDDAGFGTIVLRERMNDFERRNRVPVLFSSCMSSKGYNLR